MKHSSIAFVGAFLATALNIGVVFPVHAADCGNDPVYERNLTGKTIMGARVRSIACMEGSSVLTVLSSGATVHIIGETDGWYKVSAGGFEGWVGATLIRPTGDAPTVTEPQPVKETPKKLKIIGISEKDFQKLVAGNSSLHKQLKDMIVMRVHHRGEKYRVKANKKLEALNSKDAKEVEQTKTIAPTTGSITLTANATENGKVALSWNVNDVNVDMGFKVVVSDEINPVYPGNDYHYLSDPTVRSDIWTDLEASTHHFRVCQYLGGKCGVYSNDVAVVVQ